MKKIIVYSSTHQGNTEKIAKEMSEAINADLMKVEELDVNMLNDYDLIGFGSGIYGGKPSIAFMEFLQKLPDNFNKKAFVFSTSAFGKAQYNSSIRDKLSKKGLDVVGSFACKGFAGIGPFKIFGGISKGRPNKEDLLNARNFVHKLIEFS
ncbi:MAG: flavodoxin family protein [Clostridiaceae bacterium]